MKKTTLLLLLISLSLIHTAPISAAPLPLLEPVPEQAAQKTTVAQVKELKRVFDQIQALFKRYETLQTQLSQYGNVLNNALPQVTELQKQLTKERELRMQQEQKVTAQVEDVEEQKAAVQTVRTEMTQEVDKLKKQVVNLQAALGGAQKMLETKEKEMKQEIPLRAEVEKLRKELTSLEAKLKEAQDLISSHAKEEAATAVLRLQIQQRDKTIASLKKEVEKTTALTNELAQLKTKEEQARKDLDAKQNEVRKLKFGVINLKQDVGTLESDVKKAIADIPKREETLRKELDQREEALAAKQKSVRQDLMADLAVTENTKLKILTGQLQAKEQQLNKLNAQVAQLQKDLETARTVPVGISPDAQKQIETLTQQITQLEETITALEKENAKLKGEKFKPVAREMVAKAQERIEVRKEVARKKEAAKPVFEEAAQVAKKRMEEREEIEHKRAAVKPIAIEAAKVGEKRLKEREEIKRKKEAAKPVFEEAAQVAKKRMEEREEIERKRAAVKPISIEAAKAGEKRLKEREEIERKKEAAKPIFEEAAQTAKKRTEERTQEVQQLEQQTQKVTEYAQSIDKTKSEKDATAQPPQVISVRFSQYTVLMRQLLITSPSLFETDAFTRAQAAVTDALTKELAMIKEHPEFVNEFKAVLTPALTDFTEQAKKSKAPKAMIAAFTTQLQTMQSEVAKIQPPTAPEKKERVIEATPANVKSIAQSIQKTERKFADALEKLADIAQKMEQKQLDSSEMPEHHLRTERIGVYRAAVTHLLRQESAPKPTLSVAQVSASFKLLQNTVQQERTIVAQSIKDASKIKEFLTTLLKQGVDPIKTSIGASHGKIPRMAPKHKALWEPVLNSAYTFFTEEYKKLLPETK